MLNFIEIAKAVFALLPAIVSGIKSIEDALPGQGLGEQKLAAFRAILESVYQTVGAVSQPVESIWPAMQKVIAVLVPLLTKKGA